MFHEPIVASVYNMNFMEERILKKLASYQPSTKAVELVRQTKILLLVGISGAGKDSTKVRLLKHGGYHHIISHTTRAPRLNHGILEQNEVDYHFISLTQAEDMIDAQAFIEAKMYSGNVYGTSVAEIAAAHTANQIAVTDLEVQGVAEYKHLHPEVTAVFLLPPDYTTWQERLRSRYEGGEIDEAELHKRMHTAEAELRHALETDYFHFVINDDLAETVRIVDELVRQPVLVRADEASRAVAERLAKELVDK